MKLSTLDELLVEQLKDLYSAENQLIEALPLMAKAAKAPQLRQAFELHLQQTKQHVTRLEQALTELKATTKGKKCKAMAGLVAEGQEAIEEDSTPEIKDAALIAAAQRVEHYEIAGYGTVRTYAQTLGHQQVAQLLQTTLNEEGETDKKLTTLAETAVNQMTVTSGNHQASSR